MTVPQRIAALREEMKRNQVDAYVIPGTDPHQSEYPPDHWKQRTWISGFDGSAGTAVVTGAEAGLWTDSRYFLEAQRALTDSSMVLHRLGLPGVADHVEWLGNTLAEGSRVGFDGTLISAAAFRAAATRLQAAGVEAVDAGDLIGAIWGDRPPLPDSAIFLVPAERAGAGRKERLSALRQEMAKNRAAYHLATSLDDIAWLLNIRGDDVAYNPVALCYLIATASDATLFVSPTKLSPQDRTELEESGITVKPYEEISRGIAALPSGKRILLDPSRVNLSLYRSCEETLEPVERENWTTGAKAIKNSAEISGMKSCMVKDGVAMVKFLHWLEATVPAGSVTELGAARKLREFRAAGEGFAGESFATIAGYGPHGAIVHYRCTPESDVRIEPGGVFLLDSGGQYLDGTTDITRVVSNGTPAAAVKNDFTRVLKAHIVLARLQFPAGTTGHQIDALPRLDLWMNGLNYGHGTGHGIGWFLSVHEGPQRIAPVVNSVPLKPGMFVSNEPGLYREGAYGIRVENLVLVTEGPQTEFGQFYRFETLTLCPIELDLVVPEMLSREERDWLNAYHAQVRETLLPHLDQTHAKWLKHKTRPV